MFSLVSCFEDNLYYEGQRTRRLRTLYTEIFNRELEKYNKIRQSENEYLKNKIDEIQSRINYVIEDYKVTDLTRSTRRRQVLKFLKDISFEFTTISGLNQKESLSRQEKLLKKFIFHINANRTKTGLILFYFSLLKEYTSKSYDFDELLKENQKNIDDERKEFRDMRKNGKDAVNQLCAHFNKQVTLIAEVLEVELSKDIVFGEFNVLKDFLLGNKTGYFNEDLNRLGAEIQNYLVGGAGKFLFTGKKILIGHLKTLKKTIKKIQDLKDVLMDGEMSSNCSIYLTFGQVPNFLRNRLSYKWYGLNKTYIRDTLIGWRRRIDTFLPSQIQLEVLPKLFHSVGDELRGLNDNKDFKKIISTLEKYKVLHLLGSTENIDLNCLLKIDGSGEYQERLVAAYKSMKGNKSLMERIGSISNRFKGELENGKRLAQFSFEELGRAASVLTLDVKKQVTDTLNWKLKMFLKRTPETEYYEELVRILEIGPTTTEEKKKIKIVAVAEIVEKMGFEEPVPENTNEPYLVKTWLIKRIIENTEDDNLKRNLEKIIAFQRSEKFLRTIKQVFKIIDNERELQEIIFNNYVSGSGFSKAIARLLEKIQEKKINGQKIYEKRYSQLYTALRGIVSLAYAEKFCYFDEEEDFNSIAYKLSEFDPFKVATFPFRSLKRTKTVISFPCVSNNPIKLMDIKGKRIGFKKEVTNMMKRGEPVFVHVPLHNERKIKDGLIIPESQRDRAEKFIPLRLMPTPKILTCLSNDLEGNAKIENITILVPEDPFNGIKVRVSLSAKSRRSFRHEKKFIDELDRISRECGLETIKRSLYASSDFNAVGKYMFAFGTLNQVIDLTPLTRAIGYEKAGAKFERQDNIIATLQARVIGTIKGKLKLLGVNLRDKIVEKIIKKLKNEKKEILEFISYYSFITFSLRNYKK